MDPQGPARRVNAEAVIDLNLHNTGNPVVQSERDVDGLIPIFIFREDIDGEDFPLFDMTIPGTATKPSR